VATPLTRKDCSPICDGAAAVVLTSRPQAVRVAGLGSATDTASILDRASLTTLDATRQAARIACWRAGIASPRELAGLTVEVHDAFNSLLPIGLVDLGLADPEEVLSALVGEADRDPPSPYANPVTGPGGRLPTNMSGGLKARGHPVGGTGLFQIAEGYLQLTDRFPNRRAQVRDARIAISNSIGGPGNNNYVTILERSDSRRRRAAVSPPRLHFESRQGRPQRASVSELDGAEATVEAATTIHVRAGGGPPLHVALLSLGGRRVFAKLDQEPSAGAAPEEALAGQRVKLLVKDDGDHYFQIQRGRSFDLSRVVQSIRRRSG
jgi:hypothetical protein